MSLCGCFSRHASTCAGLHLEIARGKGRGLGGLGDVRWAVAVGESVGAVGVPVGIAIRAVGISVCAIGIAIAMSMTIAVRISVSTEVLPSVGSSIAHAAHAALLCHIHLRLPRLVVLRPDGRHEIDEEAEHVEEVDKGNDPLQHRRCVVLLLSLRHAERDSKTQLHEDEEELDPEAVAQDGVLAEVYAQTLVFPADEDGRYYVARDEEHKKPVVEVGMAKGVEDGEQDETCGTGDRPDDGANAVNLLPY